MRLMQLRYFCEVCRCGSVTHASENLHVSQPSVSVGIRELEEGYGINLFYRDKKRLVLTEEGEFFYQKALEILDMVNDLDRKMNQLAQKETPVLIGVPPMISIFLFAPLINRFYRQYPDARVEMREHGTLDAEKLVETEQLDWRSPFWKVKRKKNSTSCPWPNRSCYSASADIILLPAAKASG